MNVSKRLFGITKEGFPVTCFSISNGKGIKADVLDYGCTVQRLLVPDKNGKLTDVVLGYDDIRGYEEGSCYFGAFIGRYANRIKGSSFTLNGRSYLLSANEGNNHLHGIMSRRIFNASFENGSLSFEYISPAGEEGFPGELSVKVSYTLTEDSIIMEYIAKSSEDTVINLTNHSYFNLNGGGDILSHMLKIYSDSFLKIGEELIPTGDIISVQGTPMDFRSVKAIGRDIDIPHDQLLLAGGYDHNFILTKGSGLKKAASLKGDISGITMDVFTSEPGIQFYSGNYIDKDSASSGKGGLRYPKYAGLALEAQHYPDSPAHPEFPSVVLRAGDEYLQKTALKFSVCQSKEVSTEYGYGNRLI